MNDVKTYKQLFENNIFNYKNYYTIDVSETSEPDTPDYHYYCVDDESLVEDMIKTYYDDFTIKIILIFSSEYYNSYDVEIDDIKENICINKHKLLTKTDIEEWKIKKDLNKFNI